MTRLILIILLVFAPIRAWSAACSTTAPGTTALEKAANGLGSGQWCELTPAMLNFTQSAKDVGDVLSSCGYASSLAQYANSMAYDPSQGVAGKIFWWGMGHGGTYRSIVYDLDDNEFTVGPALDGLCSPVGGTCQTDFETSPTTWCAGTPHHANDGITDDNSGGFYYALYNETRLAKFTLPSTVDVNWSNCPTGQGTGAIDFWPDYGAKGTLVNLCGGYSPHNRIYFYDLATGGPWTEPFGPLAWANANGSINNHMQYNAGSGEILVTQGNSTPAASWKIRLVDGTPRLTRNADAPIQWSQAVVKVVDDPVDPSGKFIVWNIQEDTVGTSNAGWYEYDMEVDTWTPFVALGITSMPPLWGNVSDPGNTSVISVSIPNYNAIVFLSFRDDDGTDNGGMFVYRHSAGESPSGPPEEPPSLALR